MQSTRATFTGNGIRFNRSSQPGGGLRAQDASDVTFDRGSLSFNQAPDGAGVYITGGSTFRARDNQIVRNQTSGRGGGLWLENSTSLIQDNHILRNRATQGGGVAANGGQLQVLHNVIDFNRADHGGGILIDGGANADVRSNTACNNTVSGFSVVGASAHILFNTVMNNGLGAGGEGILLADIGSSELRANVLRSNYVGVRASGNHPLVMGRNNLWTNGTDYVGLPIHPTDLRVDPRHVSGPLGPLYLSQVAAGQPLNSPLIDAADMTAANAGLTEFATRTDGGTDTGMADIGAHFAPLTLNRRAWLPVITAGTG